jgi:hypothetical protein
LALAARGLALAFPRRAMAAARTEAAWASAALGGSGGGGVGGDGAGGMGSIGGSGAAMAGSSTAAARNGGGGASTMATRNNFAALAVVMTKGRWCIGGAFYVAGCGVAARRIATRSANSARHRSGSCAAALTLGMSLNRSSNRAPFGIDSTSKRPL